MRLVATATHAITPGRRRRTLAGLSLIVIAGAAAPAARAGEHPAGGGTPTGAAVPGATAAEARLKADVTFLAADAREGRGPGTKGIEAAADYLADSFRQIGLKPAPGADGYFQKFTIAGRPTLADPTTLAYRAGEGEKKKAALATDFTPLAVGANGSAAGSPLVFAGYGITAREEKLKYDDYAGVDVKEKAVLILRREPQANQEDSPFDGKKTTNYATFLHKVTNAFQHGARAVLLVNDLGGLGGEKDRLLRLTDAGPETFSNLPVVMVTRDLADKLLAAAGQPALAELEAEIDRDLKPRSRELKGLALDLQVTVDRPAIETKNVVGVLEGAGPLADETVVVGGHYDHLGRGGMMSGSLAFLSSDIHNGADDNASGTAMVVEIARRLVARRDPLPRRVVFIAFSGEEKGLLGSQHYVSHPLYPLASTVMMANFDMVGRLNAKNELTMIGTGTTPGLDVLVDTLGKDAGLTIKKVPGMTDGFGGSDHQSFYGKDIPVVFAFTGVHPDYHRPSDDSDRINFAGMARIADYMELILLDLVRRPERPAFVKLASPRPAARQASAGRSSVSIGVMPDYADTSKDGMKISGVLEDRPAAKAGLKGGDKIVKVGGKKVGTIYDYMESMKAYKPGDTAEITVDRDGKQVTFKVQLGKMNLGTPHD